MAEYVIQVARSAQKEIGDLPQSALQRVTERIDELESNPRPAGCVKLKVARNRWRIRVGDYRIVYAIDDLQKLVDVIAVRHRRDVYR